MRKFKTAANGIILMLVTLLALTSPYKSVAQSCNQVEILYAEPDCFKVRPSAGNIPGDQIKCKQISACVDEPSVYTSSMIGGGFTYLWTVTGPAPVTINPNNTSSQVTIVWPQVGSYTLTITVTTPGGTFTNCVTVNVRNKPIAGFTFTLNNVCAGSTISFTNTTTLPGGGGIIYSWNFNDPASGANNYSVATNPTHIFGAAGTYNVMLIASSFTQVIVQGPQGKRDTINQSCCSDTFTLPVTILPGTLKIECISTVCAGDTSTYTAVGCINTTWLTPVGGTIISSTPTKVTIVWGNGAVQGQIIAVCPGGCTTSVAVPVIPLNPQPTGILIPCNDATTSYTLPLLPGTFYNWSLNNITNGNNYDPALFTNPENNTVWINWSLLPPGVYQLTVNLNNKHICCNHTGTITIRPKGKFQAFSDQTVCLNGSATLSTSGPGNFNWQTLPAGGVVPPVLLNSLTYNPSFANTGIYTVTVTETGSNYCNTTQQVTITVVATPAPGIINGPVTVCTNSTASYSMSINAPPGYHYNWSITGGTGSFQPGNLATTTGNNASILWASVPGTITVVLVRNSPPLCPSPPVTLNVNLATTGTVSGPINVCVDGTGAYSLTGGNLPPGEPVNWTISPANHGTILSGQGTGSITILWHGQPGAGPWGGVTINATSACGAATALTGITIYPKFTFSLAVSSDICQPGGATISVVGAPPSPTYLWSNGAVTATINVTTAGPYSVTITNPGGCTFTKTILVEDPFAILPVTCGVGFCTNSGATNEVLGVIVVKPVIGPFTYQWYSGVFPGGTLISGQITPGYTAPADGQYYCVVTYGICSKHVNFTVAKVCCPNINNPQITNVVQNDCFKFTFTGNTPNPAGAAITWDFGDGNTAPGASGVPISHTYAHAGNYCVKFCVGPPAVNPTMCTGNCTSTNVTVPIEAAFIPALSCNGCLNVQNTSTIISPPAFISYLWNFGDGNFSTLANPPTHCYGLGGTYTVTLTITYTNGVLAPCTSTATSTLTYTPLSILVNPAIVCTNSPISFTSNPGGFITYNWSFGDGFNAFTPTTTHIYTTPAINVPISLTVVDITGVTCVANTQVNINPGTPCTILPAYICPGSFATLNGPAGGISYLWQQFVGGVWVAAPGINNGMNYNTTTPGQFHVIVTNANGCVCISNAVQVLAVTAPDAVIAIAPSKKLCGPGLINLTSVNHLPGYTSNWYNGNLATPIGTGQTLPFVSIGATTNIILILINQYGCSDTCSVQIEVNTPPAAPIITSNPGGPLCAGQPIVLTVSNYINNISWNTGALGNTITVYTAGAYTATYTNPVTGCSSSATIIVHARPSTDLFPHDCDSIPCDCVRPFAIYAPLPLIGPSPTIYNIQWWNANTNTQIFTGITPGGLVYNNLPTGVQTGSYYIVMTNPNTGCSDTSNNYSVVVPPCDTCKCDKSYWGSITLTPVVDNVPGNITENAIILPVPLSLKCDSAYTILCNQVYKVNAKFICGGDTAQCKGLTTYAFTPPGGPTQTGNVPFVFNTAVSGVYTLVLYGWCNGKICDSCKITFNVQCPPACNCNGSSWGKTTLTTNNGQAPLVLNCKQEYTLACNVPVTINSTYNCAIAGCSDSVTYALTTPAGVTTTGTVALTFTPTLSGTYTLVLYGYCGTKLCDSCKITFKVQCPPLCNCVGGHWGETILTSNNGQAPVFLTCKQQYNLLCMVPVTINSSYFCAGANCPDSVSYALTNPAGVTTTGAVPFTFTPTISGTYTLVLYGYCGTTLCDSCKITFKVNCPPACNCNGSKWGNIWLGAGPVIKTLECNKQYILPCALPVTINASYLCVGNNCPGTVKYALTNPAGVTTTGNVAFTFTPLLSGTYTLVLYGYCGTTLCDSCKITFKVICPPLCNCNESSWGNVTMVSGQPQVTKKLVCNSQYKIPCNIPVTINAFYNCLPANCQGAVKYALTTPAGITTTGNVALTFTPNQTGTYTLKLYGYCGDKICDSCTITFKVECCSCNGSKWGDILLESVAGVKKIDCNKQYNLSCNVPQYINASYLCNPANCQSAVTYALTNPAGVTTTGNVAFTFTPTQSGTYTLKLYGYCGGKICDSCTITFKVECCSCNGSKWDDILLTSGGTVKKVSCNKQYNLTCNVPAAISTNYICAQAGCQGEVVYKFTTPAGITTTGITPLTFTPTQTGTYTLKLYGYCGDKICDSCTITFKVECCSCNGSKWGDIFLESVAGVKKIDCNKQYSLSCNVPQYINASYLCNPANCQSAVTYALTNPAGVTTTGNVAFTFTPTQSGTYTLMLYGYCGGKICDSCKITFTVTCQPDCNCNGSKWGDISVSYGQPPVKRVVKCNQQYGLPCNVPVTVNATYICPAAACPGSVKYALTTPSGVITAGNSPFTFTPTQNGVYTLMLYGFCGTKQCEVCKITFTVNCGIIIASAKKVLKR